MFTTYPGQNVQFRLLYRSSRDQCYPSTFSSKVQGRAKTVTLITSEAGEIFGGYLDKVYDPSIVEFQADPKAFMLSLTKNEKYNILPESQENAMFYDDGIIIGFGRDDL
jgi:hypothetical protein